MDWELPALQELTIEVDFVRGGHTVFTATTWPGYVGVLTGVKAGGFSVSVNYRRTPEGNESMLKQVAKNMMLGLAGSWPVSFIVREVLEQDADFDTAVASLKVSDLMAPTYITVAGIRPGQGIVITRSRTDTAVPAIRPDGGGRVAEGGDADVASASAGGGRPVSDKETPLWGLATNGPIVQANMDYWRDDAMAAGLEDHGWQDICSSRVRRVAARAAIREAGPGVTPTDLWLLLSTPPCLAHDTVYTVAMCAATGHVCTRTSVSRRQSTEAARRWRYTIADAMAATMKEAAHSHGGATRQ